jgi:orotidine-5'-phosphate decarboxylase
VLEAADDLVAVVKPQMGFFERLGPKGLNELAVATAQARSQGSLCLIDAKRGDVAGTMEGYAVAMLGAGSRFGGDAVTVSAYLGFGALLPVFNRAIGSGAGVFVVVHSSNPDGRLLQDARHLDGRTVAEALADDITTFNAAQGSGIGMLGAVIDPAATAIIDRLPQSLILAPGVGAQGADIAEVGPKFRSARGRVLPWYLARSFATGQALSPCAMRSSVTARLLGQRGMPRLPLRRRDVAEAQGPGQRGKHAASRHELFASFFSTAHLSTALAQIRRSKLRS